jgi:hypothetical protein
MNFQSIGDLENYLYPVSTATPATSNPARTASQIPARTASQIPAQTPAKSPTPTPAPVQTPTPAPMCIYSNPGVPLGTCTMTTRYWYASQRGSLDDLYHWDYYSVNGIQVYDSQTGAADPTSCIYLGLYENEDYDTWFCPLQWFSDRVSIGSYFYYWSQVIDPNNNEWIDETSEIPTSLQMAMILSFPYRQFNSQQQRIYELNIDFTYMIWDPNPDTNLWWVNFDLAGCIDVQIIEHGPDDYELVVRFNYKN